MCKWCRSKWEDITSRGMEHKILPCNSNQDKMAWHNVHIIRCPKIYSSVWLTGHLNHFSAFVGFSQVFLGGWINSARVPYKYISLLTPQKCNCFKKAWFAFSFLHNCCKKPLNLFDLRDYYFLKISFVLTMIKQLVFTAAFSLFRFFKLRLNTKQQPL